MKVREELQVGRPLEPGHELMLSVLLAREVLARILDERLFRPHGITDQQFNVLRILRGGPPEGHLVGEVRRRMISRNADIPRLVARLVREGLVETADDPADRRGTRVRLTEGGAALEVRLRPLHDALCRELETRLDPALREGLLEGLQRFREALREGGTDAPGSPGGASGAGSSIGPVVTDPGGGR